MKKRLSFLIISAAVGSLIWLCVHRWGAWFGNPTEPAYEAADSICRVQLTFGRSGQHSRAISWQCGDSVRSSRLILAGEQLADTQRIVVNFRHFSTEGGESVYYFAEADSLAAGRYAYCIEVGEKCSEWHHFSVPKIDSLTFVYVGDVQDVNGRLLRQNFAEIQQRIQPDFWLFGGDLIERPHDQFWHEYFAMVADFCDTVPMLAIAGNHDYRKGLIRRLDERFVWTFPYFLDRNAQFSTAANFALNFDDSNFYLLDSNTDWWHFLKQRSWLSQQVENQQDKWNIATIHHPIYSLRGGLNNFGVRLFFAGLLKQNCQLVLQGHEHAYARKIDETGSPIWLVSQCSPKDYRINFNHYDRYGLGERFYQVVKICDNSLRISTFSLQHERYDEVLLVRNSKEIEVVDYFQNQPETLVLDSLRFRKNSKKRAAYQQAIERRL